MLPQFDLTGKFDLFRDYRLNFVVYRTGARIIINNKDIFCIYHSIKV